MAETTKIAWADATLNFWVGCTKVSTGDKGACEFCYAETWAKRWTAYRETWGAGAARVITMDWLSKARAIVARGRKEGRRMWVFSNSLGDIFDNEVPVEVLSAAFDVMEATPENVYLLLTKRAPIIVKRWLAVVRYRRQRDGVGGVEPSDGQLAALYPLPRNVALGITVVTQAEADRDIPHLLRAKSMLSPLFVFLSMEPLMGPVDLTRLEGFDGNTRDALNDNIRVDWVITGGESGAHARAENADDYRSIMAQCLAAGVAYFHKQMRKKGPIPVDLQHQERPRVAA